MKPTGILVNTARGPIVDEAALVEALREGTIGGAGLDVFEETPLPPGHPLLSLETVVLTPHSAAYSEEALAEVRKRPLADALRVLRGEKPKDAAP
jgi:phosphoglycerate dehydrogenase-like enzyme